MKNDDRTPGPTELLLVWGTLRLRSGFAVGGSAIIPCVGVGREPALMYTHTHGGTRITARLSLSSSEELLQEFL